MANTKNGHGKEITIKINCLFVNSGQSLSRNVFLDADVVTHMCICPMCGISHTCIPIRASYMRMGYPVHVCDTHTRTGRLYVYGPLA